MMKMSKEEFIKYIDGIDIDEDKKIEIMENITDSFEEFDDTEYKRIIEEKDGKIEELRTKYKERFMEKIDDKKDDETKEYEKEEDDDEEKVIDIKEI